MDSFLSHLKQPFTSVWISFGFVIGCITTIFYYQTLEFTVITISILIVSAYFKPFSNVLLGFICAIFYIWLYFAVFYSFELPQQDEKYAYPVELVVEEVVSSIPPQYIKAKIKRLDMRRYSYYNAPRAMLTFNSMQPLEVGAAFTAFAHLKHFRSTKNFTVFDNQLYAFTQKVFFKGKILNKQLVITDTQQKPLIIEYRSYIQQLFKGTELNWLYYVLLTGDKSLMNAQHKHNMQTLGLSHLLAISGLHISLVFGFTFTVARALLSCIGVSVKQTINISVLYSLLGFLAAFIYVYLSDFIISATRALIMLGCYVFLYCYAKQPLRWRSILYAVVVILIIDPISLFNPGLYFSFMAVVIIFIAVTKISFRNTTLLTKIALLAGIQAALFIGLLPLSVYFFKGVSLAGLGLNLIAIPLLSFLIMPLLLLLAIVSSLIDMSILISVFDSSLNFLYQQLITIPTAWRWLNLASINLSMVIFCYVSMLLLYLLEFKWLVGIPLSVLCFDSWVTDKPQWQLNVFDVGHGLMVLIEKDKQAFVYDLGPSYFRRFSRTRSILLPYINSRNLTVTNTIISHNDNDHAGGAQHFIEAGFEPSFSTFHPSGIDSHCVARSIDFNGLKIEVLQSARFNNANDDSCVVKVTSAKHKVLLTGDISKQRERALIKQGYNLHSDVLLSAHHGSRSSSSTEFISAVKPKIVIHSSAYQGQWQFPSDEVVARFNKIGASQYITGQQGQIRIKFYHQQLCVETAREQESYWFIKD